MAVITPRRTRLVRVPDLRGFRSAIRELAQEGPECLVVVPTRGAARQLLGSLRRSALSPQPSALHAAHPSCLPVTRDELYDHLHARVAGAPLRLTAIER